MNSLPDAPPDAPPDIPLELCMSPRYPARLKIAGIIWVVYGCLMVAVAAYTVLPMMVLDGATMKSIGRESVPAFFGIMTLSIGGPVCFQSLQFPAFGAKYYGVFSLLLSLWSYLHVRIDTRTAPPDEPMQLAVQGIYILGGAALIVAGILAIKARHEYRTWHEWNKAMRINGKSL